MSAEPSAALGLEYYQQTEVATTSEMSSSSYGTHRVRQKAPATRQDSIPFDSLRIVFVLPVGDHMVGISETFFRNPDRWMARCLPC